MRRVIVFLLIVIPLAAVFVVVGFDVPGRISYGNELSKWQSLGGSDDFADLAPPLLADEDNAAVLYAQAFKAIRVFEDPDRQEDFNILTGRTVDRSGANERLLKEFEPAMELVRKAADRPGCRWPVDYNAGIVAIQSAQAKPVGWECILLCRLMLKRAIHLALHGRYDEAIEEIRCGMILSNRLADHPYSVAHHASMTIQGHWWHAVQDIFYNLDATCEPLRPLFAEPDHIDRHGDLIVITGSGHIDDVVNGPPPNDFNFLRRHFVRHYHAEIVAQFRADAEQYASLSPNQKVLSDPDLADAVARKVLALLAIDLRIYRQKHSAYPDGLDESTVPPLTDPFTGGPVYYERTDEGFLIRCMNGDDAIEWQWN